MQETGVSRKGMSSLQVRFFKCNLQMPIENKKELSMTYERHDLSLDCCALLN
jgi:hypothetical protein